MGKRKVFSVWAMGGYADATAWMRNLWWICLLTCNPTDLWSLHSLPLPLPPPACDLEQLARRGTGRGRAGQWLWPWRSPSNPRHSSVNILKHNPGWLPHRNGCNPYILNQTPTPRKSSQSHSPPPSSQNPPLFLTAPTVQLSYCHRFRASWFRMSICFVELHTSQLRLGGFPAPNKRPSSQSLCFACCECVRSFVGWLGGWFVGFVCWVEIAMWLWWHS